VSGREGWRVEREVKQEELQRGKWRKENKRKEIGDGRREGGRKREEGGGKREEGGGRKEEGGGRRAEEGGGTSFPFLSPL
jgi:ATP-dependent RNA helicase DHX57